MKVKKHSMDLTIKRNKRAAGKYVQKSRVGGSATKQSAAKDISASGEYSYLSREYEVLLMCSSPSRVVRFEDMKGPRRIDY